MKDFIETEGSGITKLSLFSFVKDRGNFSDGDRFGNMSAAYSSGTSGLLELFEKAGLIPENMLSKSSPKQSNTKNKSSSNTKNKSSSNTKNKSSSNTKNKSSSKSQIKSNPQEKLLSELFNLQTNSFSISVNKKIEKDEFDLVKSQITGFLQFVEKKISNEYNSSN